MRESRVVLPDPAMPITITTVGLSAYMLGTAAALAGGASVAAKDDIVAKVEDWGGGGREEDWGECTSDDES